MKITVRGGSNSFIELLNKITDGGVSRFDTVSDALTHATQNRDSTLFLLPAYESGEYSAPELSEEDTERLFTVLENRRAYIENYPAYDYRDCYPLGLQGRSLVNNVGRYTVRLVGGLADTLGFDILQKRGGFYIPAEKHSHRRVEILAEIKNCFGVHRVVAEEDRREGVALARIDDNLYTAMLDFSRLDGGMIFSYKNWRSFYSYLLSEILGVDSEVVAEAFSSVFPELKTARDTRSKDKKTALSDALRSAIDWHLNSGILVDGGRGGVYEMMRSFDLGIAKNIRGDSGMITAALLMSAGKYFGDESLGKIANDIANCLFVNRTLQITDGDNKGLFKWFTGSGGRGAKSVYVTDSSRVGNAVYTLYLMTGEEKYRESVLSLAEALMRWLGGDPLFPGCCLNYDKESVVSVQGAKRDCCPEFYDAPLIFLRNAYRMTGDERYKEQIISTATRLAERYPDFDNVTSHSDNFTYCRLLGALSVAQSFSDGVWTEVIDKLLCYFAERQHKTGGFADGRAYYDKESLKSDVEFAVGFGDTAVADIVYCQNSMAYTLLMLSRCDGSFNKSLAEKMYSSLLDFLLDTQIKSADPKTSGAWMRAFDMDGGEYYGCDKDFAWGPYCILTGWVTGLIPLVFLDELGLTNMF